MPRPHLVIMVNKPQSRLMGIKRGATPPKFSKTDLISCIVCSTNTFSFYNSTCTALSVICFHFYLFHWLAWPLVLSKKKQLWHSGHIHYHFNDSCLRGSKPFERSSNHYREQLYHAGHARQTNKLFYLTTCPFSLGRTQNAVLSNEH